ncbi:unnamed protein product, partial [Colletotrichum noveboracense]
TVRERANVVSNAISKAVQMINAETVAALVSNACKIAPFSQSCSKEKC